MSAAIAAVVHRSMSIIFFLQLPGCCGLYGRESLPAMADVLCCSKPRRRLHRSLQNGAFMIARRMRQAGGWLFWFIHAPMSAFWLLQAFIIVAGTAAIIAGRSSFWDVLGAAMTIAGVVRIVARLKGVAAWPTRRAHAELSGHGE